MLQRLGIAVLAFALGVLVGAVCAGGEVEAAVAHRAQYPESDWGYHYYLSFAASEDPEKLKAATAFIVASSSRQQILERCVPEPVTDTLAHIDLRGLQWAAADFAHVLKQYPYSASELPLIVRADWLLVRLADGSESDAYYRLLYGAERIPRTRDEFLAAWGVLPDRSLQYGMIEGQSGVSKSGIRWLESRAIPRGYAWGTRDAVRIDPDTDPLQHLLGDQRHDGEEWIVGAPKVSITTGQRGTLQVYLLSDGTGRRVDKADTDLVEDATRFRGLSAIRTPGSCVQCHLEGLNPPTKHELRTLIRAGVDVYADAKSQAEIERFHLAEIDRDLKRANEDFATAVQAVCGLPPAQAVEAFRTSVLAYDAAIGLDGAARELGTTPDSLKQALAAASSGGTLAARLAGLAHGLKMPRATWEREYLAAKAALRPTEPTIQPGRTR